jgi:hypothetical protein
MQSSAIGAVLIVLGLAILFFLWDALIKLIIFLLEFLGIFLGFMLIIVGIGMVLAGKWVC